VIRKANKAATVRKTMQPFIHIYVPDAVGKVCLSATGSRMLDTSDFNRVCPDPSERLRYALVSGDHIQ
jgi:hypothetical protein